VMGFITMQNLARAMTTFKSERGRRY